MSSGQLAQAGRHTKVERHTTYQKARREARGFQNPCEHGGGGGFAVGACNGQHVATLQHVFRQPLGPTGVGCTRFKNGFHQGKFGLARGQPAAADHVANHVQIGLELHLLDAKAFNQLNAQSFQLIAHGRINTGIATRDTVSCFSCQGGQTSHEGAANSQNMNVHGGILGGAQSRHGRFNR